MPDSQFRFGLVPLILVLASAVLAQPLDISTVWPIYNRSHIGAGEHGGVLRIPLDYYQPLRSLNILADLNASVLLAQLYPRLLEDDALGGLPHCHICLSYQVVEDGQQIIFTLRQNLRWSDGTPLTAEDVVLTAQLFADPANRTDFRQFVQVGDDVVTYTAEDELTLVMQIPEARSEAAWKALARMRVLPAHIFGAAYAQGGWDAVTSLYPLDSSEFVSAGAWRFGSYDTEAGLVLLENREDNWITDAYGNLLPYLDELHFFGVGASSEAELLLQDEADLAFDVADGSLVTPLLNAGHRVVEVKSTQSIMDFIIPNFVHPDPQIRMLMQAREFRRALSMLIDRATYAEERYGARGTPVYNWNNRLGYRDLPFPTFSFNPSAASALLNELGLRRDLSREACAGGCFVFDDGTPLTLTLIHFDRGGLNESATWLARALRDGGLEVVNQPLTVDDLAARVYFRTTDTFRDFDLLFDSRGGAIEGREFFSAVFDLGGDYRYWGVGPHPGEGPNDVQPWEERLAELASLAESVVGQAARVAATAEATVIFAEELPMIPLVEQRRFQAYRAQLGNTFDQLTTDYQFAFFTGPVFQLLYWR
jgi:peptide/nickel transport system substrate-binding protein